MAKATEKAVMTIHTLIVNVLALVVVFMFVSFELSYLFYLLAHWFAQYALWGVVSRHDGDSLCTYLLMKYGICQPANRSMILPAEQTKIVSRLWQ
jgi:hypothetical protein